MGKHGSVRQESLVFGCVDHLPDERCVFIVDAVLGKSRADGDQIICWHGGVWVLLMTCADVRTKCVDEGIVGEIRWSCCSRTMRK